MSGKNKTSDFRQVRAGARAQYNYGKLELSRTSRLPYEFLLVNLLTFQVSDSNLLGSEQIGFGGYDTVRGYDTRVLNTDEGTIISNELRTPSVSLFSLTGHQKLKRIGDKLQLLGFMDYGVGSNRHLLAGEKSSTVLFSSGPGLRYTIAPYLAVRADYGWQLRLAETRRRVASRWHVAVVASF
jgi:hemolysin activation/secretion protein